MQEAVGLKSPPNVALCNLSFSDNCSNLATYHNVLFCSVPFISFSFISDLMFTISFLLLTLGFFVLSLIALGVRVRITYEKFLTLNSALSSTLHCSDGLQNKASNYTHLRMHVCL